MVFDPGSSRVIMFGGLSVDEMVSTFSAMCGPTIRLSRIGARCTPGGTLPFAGDFISVVFDVQTRRLLLVRSRSTQPWPALWPCVPRCGGHRWVETER